MNRAKLHTRRFLAATGICLAAGAVSAVFAAMLYNEFLGGTAFIIGLGAPAWGALYTLIKWAWSEDED